MSDYFFLFLIVLTIVAAFLNADFVLTVIYLLVGVYIFGRWWSMRALNAVQVSRAFTRRMFLGEKTPVRLQVENSSWLPVIWLQIHESLPVELVSPAFFRRVVTLGSREKAQFDYYLEGRKRGYYPIGPLALHSGDIFGFLPSRQRLMSSEYLTVYPKIVALSSVKLPSFSPFGNLRHTQPIFEDPSRVFGKRDYISGDSLRRVDWKATASSGRLQVKLYEPSIALETAIFLNLNAREYEFRSRHTATELGIVVAASLANWIVARRQAVGLATNGLDPMMDGANPQPVPPRRGRAHLMRILDVLARVESGETYPLIQLLQRELVHLAWGTSLILITSHFDEAVFDGLFQAQRSGVNIFLVPCGPLAHIQAIRQRAEYFGFPFYPIYDEDDLDLWRR